MATIKVAVRVRSFIQRELDMGCQSIIEMEDRKTRIINNKIPVTSQEGDFGRERIKEFIFDYSYWSFDAIDHHYASQEQVYLDLGTDVVNSAFEGYNACVFAYGQTGSGKTYSMMGNQDSVGLTPRICQEIFKRMDINKEAGITYRTEVSYLEIYNEKVKDLLNSDNIQHNIRVREHPRYGPYVEGLSKHLVMDYHGISDLMMKGNNRRTTAATCMNDVSSRSHAIFTLTFVQAKFDEDTPSETVSKVNLVDLAGSERADTTGATGKRLKEGGHINKSLVTLGSVISALADISSAGKGKSSFIPYRDSILTWLLKDSLGGNSKTIMIAAISPADVNYGESLSTLRYANRAKNIINKPTINEDPNVKLIRDLRNEISQLKYLLMSSKSEDLPLAEKLHANEEKVKILTERWTERWRETQKILEEQKTLALRKSGVGVTLDSSQPHLVGIDDYIFSTGITFYPLKDGITYIGGESSQYKEDIVLEGLNPEHCTIELSNGKTFLTPVEQSPCYVGGNLIDKTTQLVHGSVIMLGTSTMFRFNNPVEAAHLRKEKQKGSTLNLSRLSFLSWSSPDLHQSSENLNTSKDHDDEELPTEMLQTIVSEEFQKQPDNFVNVNYNLTDTSNSIEEDVALDDTCSLNGENILKYEYKDCMDEAKQSLNQQYHYLQIGRSKNTISELVDYKLQSASELDVTAEFDCTTSKFHQSRSHEENLSGEIFDEHFQTLHGLTEKFKCLKQELEITFPDEVEENRLTKLERCLSEISLHGKSLSDRRESFIKISASTIANVEIDDQQLPCYDSMYNFSNRNHSCSLLKVCENVFVGIPSFFMRGSGSHGHVQYQIELIINDEFWTIYRRYRRFRDLHNMVKQKYGKVINAQFPGRHILSIRSESYAAIRRNSLQEYLHCFLKWCFTAKECPLSAPEVASKENLCFFFPFFRKGDFEFGKYGTG